MSIDAMNWMSLLGFESSGAKYVLLGLCDRATAHDGEDWTCFPSVEWLGRYTSQKTRTVERHIAWLIGDCWISKIERPARERKESRFIYVVHRERPDYGLLSDEDRTELRSRLDARLAGGLFVERAAEAARSPANLASGQRRSPANLACGQPATTRQKRHDHPPKTARPPANLAEPPRPPYKADTSNNPHIDSAPEGKRESASARSIEDRDEAFEAAWSAYPDAGRRASSHREAQTAFAAERAKGASAERLISACRAYAADDKAWGASGRPLAMHNFLSRGRWEQFGGAPSSAPVRRLEPAGPLSEQQAHWRTLAEDLRAKFGDDLFASWLAGVRVEFCGAELLLIAATETARDWIQRNQVMAFVDREWRLPEPKPRLVGRREYQLISTGEVA